MELAETLHQEKVRHLPLPAPVKVTEETPITEAIRKMQEGRCGCVVVEKGGKILGVLTERDILVKYLGARNETHYTVGKIMTRNVESLPPDASLAAAIQVMTRGGYRHVPLVEPDGTISGLVTARQIVTYIAEHFPAEVINLPPRLEQKMESPEGA